jgi:hypothetical protein
MQRVLKTELVRKNGDTAVRLEIGEQSAHLQASDIDSLIEQLSLVRAAMRPAVPERMSRIRHYAVEVDPVWYVQPHANDKGVVVFLRDAGAGWAGFALSRSRALKLRDQLARYANMPVGPTGLAN